MTTETKTENTESAEINDNKSVFGPLGKYAVIGVIMVSIIVTTAIMLDRQLQTVDEQLATIEEEVAAMHEAKTDTTADTANTTELTSTVANTASDTKTDLIEETASETVATPAAAPATATTPVVAEKVEATSTDIALAQETTTAPVVAAITTIQKTSTDSAQLNMVKTENTAQSHQQQLAKENQARIEAHKLEQKKYMSKIFARIKALESQQLDRYKANQDDQIVRLRGQLTQQQQVIESLILRNKELFEMRAANMQRKQNNRAQVLNRI